MPMKYAALIVFLWIAGAFLGAAADAAFPDPDDTESDIGVVTTAPVLTMATSGGGDVSIPKPNPEFFSSLWDMATFDFAFLQNTGGQIFRLIVFGPITAAIIFGFVWMFINLIQLIRD